MDDGDTLPSTKPKMSHWWRLAESPIGIGGEAFGEKAARVRIHAFILCHGLCIGVDYGT